MSNRLPSRIKFWGAFALALGLAAQAYATGNVLLPSDSGGASSLPDLGLIPAEPSAPAAAATTSAESNPPAPLPDTPVTPLPETSKPPAMSMPAPQTEMPGMPTHVIQVPPVPQISQASLPSSIDVYIAPKFVWGPTDILIVKSQLHVGDGQVPAHCRMSANGMMQTDRGLYLFDTGANSYTQLRYDGTPGGMTIRALALCDMIPLPPNAGYVIQVGNKYQFMLRQVQCPVPPPNARKLIFHYGGNGNGQCEYQ